MYQKQNTRHLKRHGTAKCEENRKKERTTDGKKTKPNRTEKN